MIEKLTSNDDPNRERMIEKATAFLSNPKIKTMPSPIAGIRNGTLIRAEKDMPEIGVKEGTMFPVAFDGEYVRGGTLDGPSWSVDQLVDEFKEKKWWSIVGQLDEWLKMPDSSD
jgi:hypothetical protein